jgi:hypothetical protein
VSALRISVPGKPVRLILLGHDEPIYHKPAEIRLMRSRSRSGWRGEPV